MNTLSKNRSQGYRLPRFRNRLHVEQLEDRTAPGEVLNLTGISLWGSFGLFGDGLLTPGHKMGLPAGDLAVSEQSQTAGFLTDLRITSPNAMTVLGEAGLVSASPAPVYVTEVATQDAEALPILAVAANGIPRTNLPSNPDWQLGEEWSDELKAEYRASTRGLLDENLQAITTTPRPGGEQVPGSPDGVTRMTVTNSAGRPLPFDAQIIQPLLGQQHNLGVNHVRGNHHFAGPNGDLTVDLLVDTNRDGKVDDQDEKGKETWTRESGAIYNVNYVDSAGTGQNNAVSFNDQGRPINENKVILNDAYAQNLAPLVIKAMGSGLTPDMTVYLAAGSTEQIQSVHFYPSLKPGTEAIGGGLGDRVAGQEPESQFIDVTPYVSQSKDVTMGVEGMFFRNLSSTYYNHFDGYLDLSLIVFQGKDLLGEDNVEMKVAPWIAYANSQPSEQIWAANFGATNASFLFDSRADPGYYGLDHSGQLQTVGNLDGVGTQWIVDHVAEGYTQRPGGPAQKIVFRLPYFRGTGVPQPAWPQRRLLGPDVGTFQLGVSLGAGAGDYGGNHAVLPPTPDYPLGRIIQGDSGSTAMFTFLQSQEVQAPFHDPTRWLAVGHNDEVDVFTQDAHTVVIADTTEAYRLLEALSPAEKGSAVFFAKGRTPIAGTTEDGSTATRIYIGDADSTGMGYVRIYDSSASGSGAAGQIARIVGRGPGYIDVGQVYNTTSTIAAPGGTSVPSAMRWMLAATAPHQNGWYNLPQPGDKFVLMEDSRQWVGGTPAAVTVQEVLADTGFRALNERIQGKIDTIRNIFDEAGGKGKLNFVPVPVLYVGNNNAAFDTGRSAVAFTAGLQNLQPLGTGKAAELYMARQFGPRNGAGVDIFEQDVLKQLPNARFVDDWDLYHRLEGEVHCGTTVLRTPYEYPWWSA